MNRPSIQTLKLPVGDVPDWENANNTQDGVELKNVSESYVILQSLKQSRERWLRSTFPKFSTRSRGGKQADVVPPPHTLYNRGRCTLEIGPHMFMDTTVFEVHYHPVHVPVVQPTTFVYQSATPSSSLQPSTQFKVPALPSRANEISSTPSPALPSGQSTPLLTSLSSAVPVTHALVTQVNKAAASNPTLANLLQLAVAGKASPEQLKTLGLLIQSLATSPAVAHDGTPLPPTPAQPAVQSSSHTLTVPTQTTQYQLQVPDRDFDLVLEFREAPSDRWTFPRGPAKCEFVSVPGLSGMLGDILLTAIVPFTAQNVQANAAANEATSEVVPKEIVVFRFKSASAAVWDTISRWVGPKAEENAKILSDVKHPERKFLAHRLPEGPELAQIQAAAAPPFSTKPIKPAAENTKPKRRLSRKDGDAPKRRRATQTKETAPPKIACFSCGQPDVPLIQGGRYCRPCVDSGKAGGPPLNDSLAPVDGQSRGEYRPDPLPMNPQIAVNPFPPAQNTENPINNPSV